MFVKLLLHHNAQLDAYKKQFPSIDKERLLVYLIRLCYAGDTVARELDEVFSIANEVVFIRTPETETPTALDIRDAVRDIIRSEIRQEIRMVELPEDTPADNDQQLKQLEIDIALSIIKLPTKQIEMLEYIALGIPINSDNEEEKSISKILDIPPGTLYRWCSEIRNIFKNN